MVSDHVISTPKVRKQLLAVLGIPEKPATAEDIFASLADDYHPYEDRLLSARHVSAVRRLGSGAESFAGESRLRSAEPETLEAQAHNLVSEQAAPEPASFIAALKGFEIPQPAFQCPQNIPGFSRKTIDDRIVWETSTTEGVNFEFIAPERESAIKRFLLTDILAFQDSEEDYLDIGRPSKHDVWASLQSNNGLLVIAYKTENFSRVDDSIRSHEIFSNGKWQNTNIFDDLAGGIYLKLERRGGKNFMRIYSLAVNPNCKGGGIGTKLVRLAAQALKAPDSPIEDKIEAMLFNFYWFNNAVNACYFVNNPELNGFVNGVHYDAKKLQGVIPISEAFCKEAQACRDKLNHTQLVSRQGAMDAVRHLSQFMVRVPETALQPKLYTDDHRTMIELYEHMFNRHKTIAMPVSLPGKQTAYVFLPMA